MTLFRTNGTDSDSGSSSEASTSSHFSTSEDEIGLEDLKAFSNIDSHLQPTTSTENNVTVIPQIHRLIQLRKLVEGNSYCSLLVELKKIKKCATIETGLLFRLIEDLELKFGISSTKALRKSLTSDDAAALLKLEQLLKLRPEWMNGVVQKCKINPPPSIYLGNSQRRTRLLNSIESVVISKGRGKIDLSTLRLDYESLSTWSMLRGIENIICWYCSFDKSKDAKLEARFLMERIRILDLSRNRLEYLPNFVVQLFPFIDTLSLLHNSTMQCLPPCILKLPLRKFKFKSISSEVRTSKSRGEELEIMEQLPRIRISRLSSICMKIYRQKMKSIQFDSEFESDFNDLPTHLQDLILNSFTCISCLNFITSNSISSQSSLYEKIHHLSPGIFISIPTRSNPSINRLTTIERVLLAVLSRGEIEIPTFLIGPPQLNHMTSYKRLCLVEENEESKFCRTCIFAHRRDIDQGGERCECFICIEERERKNDVPLRWLRR